MPPNDNDVTSNRRRVNVTFVCLQVVNALGEIRVELFMAALTSSTTPKELAQLLGTSHSKLTYAIYVIGARTFYSEFEIKKKSGGTRTIRAPSEQLKNIQRRLKGLLEQLYKPHSSASAFIGGRGIVYNAQNHTKKRIVFNIDLKDFYNSIHFGRVRGLLMSKPYSLRSDTAKLISHICCFDQILPQGAPTSPIISNMICRRMDKEMSLIAKNSSAYYSRYADDITFSFREKMDNNIYYINPDENKSVIPHGDLINCITENSFSVNISKTRLKTSSERQTVTGLTVNKKVNIDRRYIRTTKAMIHSLSFGIEDANEKFSLLHPEKSCRLETTVLGRINYIGMIKGKQSTTYQMLASKFNNLPLDIDAPMLDISEKGKIDQQLHFRTNKFRAMLEKCVWVVDFEDVENISVNAQLVQGSAFVISGGRILTAAHTFAKADDSNTCFLYRIKDPAIKYKARIKSINKISDIAELEFESEDIKTFPFLTLAKNLSTNMGYKLAIVGFPQLTLGHQSVTITPCTVTNTFAQSTFTRIQVDKEIQAGTSGGPVVNIYSKVVGMALTGQTVFFDEETQKANLEGMNAFISASHF